MVEWVTVPAGEFVMGSDAAVANVLTESPAHRVHVAAFQISRTPITNAQYREFMTVTGYRAPGHWQHGEIPAGQDENPVTYVDWDDANAFARWLGARLPTEAEWEKAARGVDGRLFPWGNTHAEPSHAHFAQHLKDSETVPVYAHPNGTSPYGALDMAGNVWEWVSTVYRSYPYRADDGREDHASRAERVLRGGSFYSGSEKFIYCTTRSSSFPTRRRDHIGFRVARSI